MTGELGAGALTGQTGTGLGFRTGERGYIPDCPTAS